MKYFKTALCLLLAGIMILSTVLASSAVTAVIIGDADGDSSVTIFDATVIQRKIADLPLAAYVEAAADADGDGIVTVLDATEIQRYLSDLTANENIGKISGGPAEEVWIDKDKATKLDYDLTEELYIREIYPDYFIADPFFPLPGVYKINGSLSDQWCIGDHVEAVITNIYFVPDEYPERYEADLVSIKISTFVPDPNVAYKPVIYLYPEEETEVNVSLDLDGELLTSAPLYRSGWTVTASDDGTLTDANGKQYDYLFWEAKLNANYDMSEGFCVSGEDTEAFLNDSLSKLGLTQREADDFIEFWLPILSKNPYNVISFQNKAYTDAAGLNVNPQPDTVIRVFMTYYPSDTKIDIPAQQLSAPARSGFTVVEWGGSMVG